MSVLIVVRFATLASFASLSAPREIVVALVIGFVLPFAPMVLPFPTFPTLVVVVVVVVVLVGKSGLPRVLRDAKHVFLVVVFVFSFPSQCVDLSTQLWLV